MSNTLSYKDSINREGYTVIDGERIVQYVCRIDSDNPENMRISLVKLKPELYRKHRAVCREDYATFEDACYQLQEELLAKCGA